MFADRPTAAPVTSDMLAQRVDLVFRHADDDFLLARLAATRTTGVPAADHLADIGVDRRHHAVDIGHQRWRSRPGWTGRSIHACAASTLACAARKLADSLFIQHGLADEILAAQFLVAFAVRPWPGRGWSRPRAGWPWPAPATVADPADRAASAPGRVLTMRAHIDLAAGDLAAVRGSPGAIPSRARTSPENSALTSISLPASTIARTGRISSDLLGVVWRRRPACRR
jgi:hypothetical protein